MKKFSSNSSFKIIRVSDKKCQELSFNTYYQFEAKKFDTIELSNDKDVYEIVLENPDIDAIITQSENKEDREYENIMKLPNYFKRRWFHFKDYYNHGIDIALAITNSQYSGFRRPLFSIVTPLYNTKLEYFKKTYKSLTNQILNDWEWILVDDSPQKLNDVYDFIKKQKDVRLRYYRIKPTHGNIGLSKWRANCLSNGQWLIELDHDDMLPYWSLVSIKQAIDAYPNNMFIYSDNGTINENDMFIGPLYGENGFGLGFGFHYDSPLPNGKTEPADASCPINNATIRHIVGMPNHFRCWNRDFYFKIGGHNVYQRIADDYELLVRSFLHTRFTHIPISCYYQRFDGNNSQYNDKTEVRNIDDIQRRVRLASIYYDEAIHNRLEELGADDSKWIKGDPYETAMLYHSDYNMKNVEDIFIPEWAKNNMPKIDYKVKPKEENTENENNN